MAECMMCKAEPATLDSAFCPKCWLKVSALSEIQWKCLHCGVTKPITTHPCGFMIRAGAKVTDPEWEGPENEEDRRITHPEDYR